jgi:anti-anti-sigma factor
VDDSDGHDLFIGQRIKGGAIVVLELSGYLDVEAMPRLAMCTDDICSTEFRHVQIEMDGLTSVDDVGFRILGTFCLLLQRQGCSLILVGPQPLVHNLLSQFWLAASGTEEEDGARGTALGLGRPAIPLSPVQQCELRLLERELCAQEPALAAMFTAYERLVDD